MTQTTFRTLAQAVEAHYEELRSFILRRTGSVSLAEDVIQEAWIRASSTGAAMPVNPRAYLYRMAANLAIDHVRRIATRAEIAPEDARLHEVPSSIPTAEIAVAAREELAILIETVRNLPDKCRHVFLLYRGEGLSMRQIAERLDISESTVERHIARAMVECRQKLRAAGRNV